MVRNKDVGKCKSYLTFILQSFADREEYYQEQKYKNTPLVLKVGA